VWLCLKHAAKLFRTTLTAEGEPPTARRTATATCSDSMGTVPHTRQRPRCALAAAADRLLSHWVPSMSRSGPGRVDGGGCCELTVSGGGGRRTGRGSGAGWVGEGELGLVGIAQGGGQRSVQGWAAPDGDQALHRRAHAAAGGRSQPGTCSESYTTRPSTRSGPLSPSSLAARLLALLTNRLGTAILSCSSHVSRVSLTLWTGGVCGDWTGQQAAATLHSNLSAAKLAADDAAGALMHADSACRLRPDWCFPRRFPCRRIRPTYLCGLLLREALVTRRCDTALWVH